MAKKIQHKRGDEFGYAGQLAIGESNDLTGWALASQIRDNDGFLIADLAPQWIDITSGVFAISVETSDWPLAPRHNRAEFDLQMTSPDGKAISTETIFVEIERDATNA